MILWKKFKEVGLAIVPILALMLLFFFTGLAPMKSADGDNIFLRFMIGLVMVVAGEVLFLIGVENSILTMGNAVGAAIPKMKKLWIVLAFGFLFGFLCTMAEPDLQVLGHSVEKIAGINLWLLISVISLGVGICIALSLIKTFTGMKLKHILLISYTLVFALAIAVTFVNPGFMAISFDSGGVTTGPITVPFILALGIGVAAGKSGSKSDDSFGMIALASVGPIIAMYILGLFSPVSGAANEAFGAADLLSTLLSTMLDVAIGLGPITAVFLVFQFIAIRLPGKKLAKILAAVLINFAGLVLFLAGVEYGFSQAAFEAGRTIAGGDWWWILIPAGIGIGVATVYTEPAVIVLGAQVDEVTGGQVTKKALINSLAAAIGAAILFAVLRALFKLDIWWFIGAGYLIAFVLVFFAPDIFIAIAFDSGGVASGPMTATFSLPLIMGICAAKGYDQLTHAFGVVAFVAMMPLIVVQVLGVIYKYKSAAVKRKLAEAEAAAVAREREWLKKYKVADDSDFSGI
ncbi:membrane protein [Clostridia bacterium]|nr:membrane protein [Clostridia bacterium]